MAKKSVPVDKRAALLPRKTVNAAKEEGDGFYPDLPETCEAFPILNAMLCVNRVDGQTRQGATITFWMEDCGVKAVMSDRSCKRKLWAQSPSLMGLLGELEAALTAKNIDWRSDAGTKKRG